MRDDGDRLFPTSWRRKFALLSLLIIIGPLVPVLLAMFARWLWAEAWFVVALTLLALVLMVVYRLLGSRWR